MRLNRPYTIKWFDWFFWAGIIIGYIGEFLIEGRIFTYLLVDIVVMGLLTFFWFQIALRASNIFRWIYTFLAFIGIAVFVMALTANTIELAILDYELLGMSSLELAISAFINTLYVGSVVCLFLKPSQIWFESGSQVVDQDKDLLDVFR